MSKKTIIASVVAALFAAVSVTTLVLTYFVHDNVSSLTAAGSAPVTSSSAPLTVAQLLTQSGADVTYAGTDYGKGWFPQLPEKKAQTIQVYTFPNNTARDWALYSNLSTRKLVPSFYGND